MLGPLGMTPGDEQLLVVVNELTGWLNLVIAIEWWWLMRLVVVNTIMMAIARINRLIMAGYNGQ